jgi:hypothetical protein
MTQSNEHIEKEKHPLGGFSLEQHLEQGQRPAIVTLPLQAQIGSSSESALQISSGPFRQEESK